MSGIVGIWNLDGRPASPSLLASMSGRLAHRGSDTSDQWCHGPVGLACRLLRVTPESLAETQPTIGPSGAALVFDGRLDNRAELLSLLSDAPVTTDSPDPVLVLTAYDRFGDRLGKYLNGDFAFGLFDQQQQRLLLVRDSIGVRPLYYTRVGDTVLFASEIKALLAHPDVPACPNDDMLACFLLNSTPSDTSMTCFRGITSLLPAHCMVVTPGRTATRRYWDFPVTEQRFGSFHEYAQAFRYHFTNAVRRRLRSAYPVAVSVSGGLDSSSILCLGETLRRNGHSTAAPLLGLSYLSPAGSPSDEQEFLVQIEAQYGLVIERIPDKSGLMDDCHEAMWHIEAPFLDSQWDTTSTFYRLARTMGARTVLTGHWADQVLFPQGYLIDLFRHLRWRDIGFHLQQYGRWMTDVPVSIFIKRFFTDLVKYHVPEFSIPYLRRLRARRPPAWYSDSFCRHAFRHLFTQPRLGAAQPTAHARSLYEEARSPYHVQCLEWNSKVAAMHGTDIAFPFLDRDLLTFLMSIPGDVQTWNGIPKALLREGMRGILPDAIVNRKWKADFTHLVNEGMERDFPRLLDCLKSGSAAMRWGYVDRPRLQEQLQALQGTIQGAATGEVAWSLTDLLGLELWLQVFFEQRSTGNKSITTEPSLEIIGAGGIS